MGLPCYVHQDVRGADRCRRAGDCGITSRQTMGTSVVDPGGGLAVLFFFVTLSFMISTPGIGEPTAGGFPVLSDNGEFLMKDIGLMGLAVWTLSDSWEATRRRSIERLDRGPVVSC